VQREHSSTARLEVVTSLSGLRVCRVMDRVETEKNLPEAIVLESELDFLGRACLSSIYFSKSAGTDKTRRMR
jgi:hypothetical protein